MDMLELRLLTWRLLKMRHYVSENDLLYFCSEKHKT